MLYSFTKTAETISGNLIVKSKEGLAFVYEAIALSEKADIRVENINDEVLTAVYDDAGVQSNFYDNRLYVTKKPVSKTGILIKDFSECPHLVLGFAVVCAAKGMLADLKGLEALTKEKGTGVVADFQKEIYRFNINTDFCDYSKLKIFNNKEIKQKSKPLNSGTNDFLSIPFIPLAIVFGKMEIELPDDFEEKYSEIISLLGSLNVKFEKR
ncbi:MAG TPA: hypothetical protein VJY62_02185 [Bacteroidia bacterium]|nr:hypothetical protein [Bacteroidia bacterium]